MTTATITTPAFAFPSKYSFPPFFTLQPVPATRSAQLSIWSTLIQSYYRFHHLFRLVLVDALDSPLLWNKDISRRLGLKEAQEVVEWMVGEGRAEWCDGGKSRAWVYWKTPEEWAGVIGDWVEETGQKNTVLTLYELIEGEATISQEFHGMDSELLQKSLNVLVKRGKAQVFGEEDSQGVKFY
ncbi:MAG: hypothetical protein M1834_001828 [Cirrosporium novae-zelandiae]|nr:MAG: hypothetical protein M1834_001828 [Cirrosporium novae-zelandiae]